MWALGAMRLAVLTSHSVVEVIKVTAQNKFLAQGGDRCRQNRLKNLGEVAPLSHSQTHTELLASNAMQALDTPDGIKLHRQTFTMDSEDARKTTFEWMRRWPVATHWTRVESWSNLPDGRIRFTMVRLPSDRPSHSN